MHTTPWLLRQAGPQRRMRLFCFAYAGGNAASFMPWQAELDVDIEVCAVQLPGRGGRFGEAPYTSMSELVETLAGVVGAHADLPFAFFGHSLGALLAFELARYLQRHQRAMPQQLIVSGCNAPQMRNPSANLHLLGDAALIEELRKYNGTPAELLQHRELMELLLPSIRADFSLAETYVYQPGALLDLPMTALAGRRDPRTSAEQVEGWQKETSNICRVEWFQGDHFFLNPERAGVLEVLRAVLAEVQCSPC
ncbi:thioesterase II family protein [Janthinobacterium fluminis]|uniref:Alpha/beta fold hydrolase n=1 Tax=Janthinobacterium fluminis TaxID=2987524 RepID=A0ABT5K0B3_9BURK|nr:alpha/beta fold hydrolase [Janthinobacterium fluminis]MDC8758409.1 alpha/beta fold hydrolase [Janthinobacterium fluminis]